MRPSTAAHVGALVRVAPAAGSSRPLPALTGRVRRKSRSVASCFHLRLGFDRLLWHYILAEFWPGPVGEIRYVPLDRTPGNQLDWISINPSVQGSWVRTGPGTRCMLWFSYIR